MNDIVAKAIANTSQSHGDRRSAEGEGSATGAVFTRVDWSAAVYAVGLPESCRSLAASAGAAEGVKEREAVRSPGAAAAGVGDERVKPSEFEAAAAPPALDACGALTAFGAGAPVEADCIRGKYAITAEAMNRKIAAPVAKVEKVRSGASQTGTDTRGTSDRDGTGIGSAAMSRAVPRSSARRVRQSAHVSRCACTEARASAESALSRYAERSPNGCTA